MAKKASELKPDPEPTVIDKYLGWDVIGTSVAVRNAGDGLSKGMSIDPKILTPGATVIVAIECEVVAHDYKRVPDEEAFELVQVLKAGTAVILEAASVRKALDVQRAAEQRDAEKKAGIVRLQLTDEDKLLAEHEAGKHAAGLRGGCPECDREAELSKAGE